MRDISIRALIAGNLLNPAILFASALAMVLIGGAVLQRPDESYIASIQALSHAQGFLVAIGLAGIAIVAFVGYVAASLSSRALPLNAALSTAVLILWNFALLFRPSTGPDNWLVTGLTWAVPLFAALGGYARARQVAQGTPPIRWGRAARFVLAIFAALLVEFIVFALLARAAPSVAILSAIGASLIAAYAIAPSERRTVAAWTLLGIAALGATGIFLYAFALGTLKFFDYFLLLSVAGAGIIGRRTVLGPVKAVAFSPPLPPKPAEREKAIIQSAPRTDPATQHLWMRPERQRGSKEENS